MGLPGRRIILNLETQNIPNILGGGEGGVSECWNQNDDSKIVGMPPADVYAIHEWQGR